MQDMKREISQVAWRVMAKTTTQDIKQLWAISSLLLLMLLATPFNITRAPNVTIYYLTSPWLYNNNWTDWLYSIDISHFMNKFINFPNYISILLSFQFNHSFIHSFAFNDFRGGAFYSVFGVLPFSCCA